MGGNLFGIGLGELIFLIILALIVFGPRRIPEVARTVGRFVRQVRQATGGVEDEMRRLMAGEGDPAAWLAGAPAQRPPSPAEPLAPPPDKAPPPRADAPPPGQGDDAPAPDTRPVENSSPPAD